MGNNYGFWMSYGRSHAIIWIILCFSWLIAYSQAPELAPQLTAVAIFLAVSPIALEWGTPPKLRKRFIFRVGQRKFVDLESRLLWMIFFVATFLLWVLIWFEGPAWAQDIFVGLAFATGLPVAFQTIFDNGRTGK